MTDKQKLWLEAGALGVGLIAMFVILKQHAQNSTLASGDVNYQPTPVYSGGTATSAAALPTVAPVSPTFNITLPKAVPVTLPGSYWGDFTPPPGGGGLASQILSLLSPSNGGGCGCGTSSSAGGAGALVSATPYPYAPPPTLIPDNFTDTPQAYPPIPDPPTYVWNSVAGQYQNPYKSQPTQGFFQNI